MAVHQEFCHRPADADADADADAALVLVLVLALRHDYGSNFMAGQFQKQARFCGISPSYAFVGQPEANGVIERLFRTLKEQAVRSAPSLTAPFKTWNPRRIVPS